MQNDIFNQLFINFMSEAFGGFMTFNATERFMT